MWEGIATGSGRFSVLSHDEIEDLHAATLDLLQTVGILVREPRALGLLVDAGATRVGEGERVLLPPDLVMSAVAAAPKQWTWHARSRKHDLRIGQGGRTKLGPGSACSRFVDPRTGEVRTPTAEDGDRLVRLMDALEFVDINYTPVMVDSPEGTAGIEEVATLVRDLQNTSKPMVGPSYNGAMARDGLEIAAILAGGTEELRKRPTLAGYVDPVAPLVHDRMMTETLLEYAAMGQPVFLTCLDLAGASAPSSLAGTLVQQNAEILSGVVIAHLVNPQAPVVYGCVSGAMDLRAGSAALGGPEFGLLSAASVQLAHFYGLPCSAGGQSDARIHDAQAALEKAMTLMASVLAGADFVDLFFGSFDGFNTTSLEQVLIDHDIAGYVFRYAAGIDVTEETLALDILRDVGAGGSFLRSRRALEFSMRCLKQEYCFPDVLPRRDFGDATTLSRTLLDLARERALRIVETHTPEPVDADVLREIHAVLERVRRRHASPSSAQPPFHKDDPPGSTRMQGSGTANPRRRDNPRELRGRRRSGPVLTESLSWPTHGQSEPVPTR